MRESRNPVLERPHRVGDDEGFVEVEHDGKAPEVEHPHTRVVQARPDGAAPEAGGPLCFRRHRDEMQFLISEQHNSSLSFLKAGYVEAGEGGILGEGAGLDLEGDGGGGDGVKDGEGRASLAGRG